LERQTDTSIERCLNNPNEKAVDAMALAKQYQTALRLLTADPAIVPATPGGTVTIQPVQSIANDLSLCRDQPGTCWRQFVPGTSACIGLLHRRARRADSGALSGNQIQTL
jgi:hypothetical protein